MIRLRRLRLVGTSRNYEVSFLDPDGAVRPLSIIAGEISTGKSSVLEFTDYCLGGSRHPQHIEIRRQVRAALLELELSGQTYVIERPLFADEQSAWVHHCDLSGLEGPHKTAATVLSPVGAANSLSTLLLEHIGLDRMRLREAPTQQASRTDPLSFRDVMWLCFLPNNRLDSRQLLQEQHHMRELKLRQVIEVLFGVHDQQLAALGERLTALDEERRDQEREIESLQTFLREDEVPDRLTLEGRLAELDRRVTELRSRLSGVSARMRAETDFAEELRATYAKLRRESDVRAARVRDRDTLLRRLLPLRGQYAEDETKLVFFGEAKRLFDPLRVTTCPSCLQELPAPAGIEPDQTCSLCRQELRSAEDESIDVEAERAALRLRLRAIDAYIDEVEEELAKAHAEQRLSAEREAAAQAQLDSDLAAKLSPFVAERDLLVTQREAAGAERRDTERQVRWLDALDRRRLQVLQLSERITQLREEIKGLQANRPSRDSVVAALSRRFEEVLKAFGFPKLHDPEGPYLDDRFVPYVRGGRYSDIGSTGALTLIALAWQLSIFETAFEQGDPHPGFLMIDSPQKNLAGDVSAPARTSGDEFRDPAIVQRVWDHLARWSAGPGREAQLLVVDNVPPASVFDAIVARYSGRADEPPYGLIDNEVS